MTPRSYFTQLGKLKSSDSLPKWDWSTRWFLLWLHWSTDLAWCDMTDKGLLVTSRVAVARVENTQGDHLTRIVVGPVAIQFAWLRSGADKATP